MTVGSTPSGRDDRLVFFRIGRLRHAADKVENFHIRGAGGVLLIRQRCVEQG